MNIKKKLCKHLIVLCIVMLWCLEISAFEVCKTDDGSAEIKWQNPTATYYINTSEGPPETQSAIEAGMQTWTDVGSSEFTFISGGTTQSLEHGINDGYNIVTFGLLAVGTVAENRFWYITNTGQMRDSDIRLNSYYSWTTDESSGGFNVQNVSTHEHGHSLCLKDLYSGADSDKTMYGIVANGEMKKQSLDADDINGITYLYACPDDLPVWISGTSYEYSSIQDAYIDAESGEVIQLQATAFAEDLLFDIGKSVEIKGRYNCDYTKIAGVTIIKGNLTIGSGTITIGDVILE